MFLDIELPLASNANVSNLQLMQNINSEHNEIFEAYLNYPISSSLSKSPGKSKLIQPEGPKRRPPIQSVYQPLYASPVCRMNATLSRKLNAPEVLEEQKVQKIPKTLNSPKTLKPSKATKALEAQNLQKKLKSTSQSNFQSNPYII